MTKSVQPKRPMRPTRGVAPPEPHYVPEKLKKNERDAQLKAQLKKRHAKQSELTLAGLRRLGRYFEALERNPDLSQRNFGVTEKLSGTGSITSFLDGLDGAFGMIFQAKLMGNGGTVLRLTSAEYDVGAHKNAGLRTKRSKEFTETGRTLGALCLMIDKVITMLEDHAPPGLDEPIAELTKGLTLEHDRYKRLSRLPPYENLANEEQAAYEALFDGPSELEEWEADDDHEHLSQGDVPEFVLRVPKFNRAG